MKKIKALLSILCFCAILASCSSPITITGSKTKLVEAKNVGLIETIVSPHVKPIFPLIDAAFYKSSLDDIAPFVMKYNKEIIDSIQTCVKSNLSTKLNLLAYSYQDLKAMDRSNILKDSIVSKRLDYNDEDFPRITIIDSAINLFNFIKSHPMDYADEDSPLYSYNKKPNSDIIKICKELKLDVVAVSVFNVVPREYGGFFLPNWYRCLNVELHFYGADGIKFLTLEFNDEKGLEGSSDDPENYKKCINEYQYSIPFMLDVLLGKQENKFSKYLSYIPKKTKTK